MIALTRFDGSTFYLNPDLIEHMEARPDTVLTLTTEKKLIVKERPDQVISRIIQYRRRIHSPFELVTREEES